MTKEQEIIELLRQGKSYSYIQKIVQVSPSKIASVKKLHMEGGSELSETLNDTTTILPATTSVNTESSGTTTTNYLESQNNLINNLKNKLTMDANEIFEDDDLEVIKLKLAHDIAMKNLEKDNEELSLRKRELRLKEEIAFADKKKTEKQGKSLIFRFRKLVEKIEDGEWTHGEIDECVSKMTDLKDEIEKYCFENDIDSDDLSVLVILKRMELELEEVQDDDAYLDDTTDLEFGDEVLEMVERAKDIDFDDYE